MIKPICGRCGNELGDFGGLLFSPPSQSGTVRKWHLCAKCYSEIEKEMK